MECVQGAGLTNHREEAGKTCLSNALTELLLEKRGEEMRRRRRRKGIHQEPKEEEVVAYGQHTLCFPNDKKEIK